MKTIENLSEEEAYLYAILTDESGLDLAEFCWHEPSDFDTDTCWRARDYQWSWFRCTEPLQIDQCVAEGTLIATERGQVPIEDVQIGDLVLTHKGRYMPVTYKWDRGEQNVVSVSGHGHPGLRVTSDHKFWLVDEHHPTPGWWKVPEVGDRWMSPARFPFSTVPPMPERGYAPGRPNNIPYHVASEDFLWLYGLYLAEGSCSSSFGKGGTVNRTTFSVHTSEVPEIEARLQSAGLRFNTQIVRGEECYNIVVNSRPLAEWMTKNGGKGAHNKQVAPWVLGRPASQRRAVLNGAAFGDGYNRKPGRVEYSTTSRALAVSIKMLAQSLDLGATLTTTPARTSFINGRKIRGGGGYVVCWQPTSVQGAVQIYEGYAQSGIKSKSDAGTTRVYDLEVAEDHSFIAEGIIVSNCARSVGKSLSIKLRAFAFPFLWPGQEMVITAPELNHLEAIVELVEGKFWDTRLGREIMMTKRGGVTHRPFSMKFENGARIMGRIPQKDGKGVKGIHPIWLELDEGQDFPEKGWVELIETLKRGVEGAVWRAHGVTKGVRDYFYKFTTDPNSKWTVHKLTAMHRPDWTDEERQEKIEAYGSKDNPDYRRNVLGEHGDATNPLFVLTRLMKCVDDNSETIYNSEEYVYTKMDPEYIQDYGGDAATILDLPAGHLAKYKSFWIGMDVGFTRDPSEILVFAEYNVKGEELTSLKKMKKAVPMEGMTRLKLVNRVQMRRVGAPDQCRVMKSLIDHYKPKAFAMDATGNGLPLFQFLQEFNPEYLNYIKGYKFNQKILVDFDQRVVVDEFKGDMEKDAGVERQVLEYATDKLREVVDMERLWLPWDRELIGEFQGQTYTIERATMDSYGRKRYSDGEFHALDACRMAVLGWKQFAIEELTSKKTRESVIDLPVF